WELFDKGARLDKIATGFGFLEGPVWDEHGFLYVSDEVQNKVSRVFPDGRVETVLSIGDPDGSTLDRRGRLITCASVLRAIVQIEPDGKYKVLADTYQGKKFNSPNLVLSVRLDLHDGAQHAGAGDEPPESTRFGLLNFFHRSQSGFAQGREAGASL